jgi:hypothetical protein
MLQLLTESMYSPLRVFILIGDEIRSANGTRHVLPLTREKIAVVVIESIDL